MLKEGTQILDDKILDEKTKSPDVSFETKTQVREESNMANKNQVIKILTEDSCTLKPSGTASPGPQESKK